METTSKHHLKIMFLMEILWFRFFQKQNEQFNVNSQVHFGASPT